MHTCFALEIFILGNYSDGALKGFTQTPQGGSSGSTSFERPSFEELNIHRNTFYSLGAKLFIQDYFWLFNYYHFAPGGQTILSEPLTTHGQLITAGNSFAADFDYDLYSSGVGKAFFIGNFQAFTSFEINFLKYHYEFSSFPIQSARTFNVIGINFGLKLHYDFTPSLSVDAQISCPIPTLNLTVINSELGLNKRFYGKFIDFMPRVGVGLLQLDYKDKQPIPNHMRYTNAPYFILGLTAMFCV